MNPFKLPIRSMQSKVSAVRGIDRPVTMQNCEIVKAGEAKRRPGFVRRLNVGYGGPVRVIAPFSGLCGRFYRYVDGSRFIDVSDEPEYIGPDEVGTELIHDWVPASEDEIKVTENGTTLYTGTPETPVSPVVHGSSSTGGVTGTATITASRDYDVPCINLLVKTSGSVNYVVVYASSNNYPSSPGEMGSWLVGSFSAGSVVDPHSWLSGYYYSAWPVGPSGLGVRSTTSIAGIIWYDTFDTSFPYSTTGNPTRTGGRMRLGNGDAISTSFLTPSAKQSCYVQCDVAAFADPDYFYENYYLYISLNSGTHYARLRHNHWNEETDREYLGADGTTDFAQSGVIGRFTLSRSGRVFTATMNGYSISYVNNGADADNPVTDVSISFGAVDGKYAYIDNLLIV